MKLKKNKSNILIIVLTIIIFVPLFYKFALMVSPGAYNNLEYYEFDITKKELVSAIMKFKERNPSLNPPQEYSLFVNPNYDINDIFSAIDFYFPNEKYIVKIFISELYNDKTKSRVGFYSIIDVKDNTINRYKEINQGLGCSENRRYIKMFEDRIVNPLRKQIEADKKKKQ